MTISEILACEIPEEDYFFTLREMQSRISIYADLEPEQPWFKSLCASFTALWELAQGKTVVPEGAEVTLLPTSASEYVRKSEVKEMLVSMLKENREEVENEFEETIPARRKWSIPTMEETIRRLDNLGEK